MHHVQVGKITIFLKLAFWRNIEDVFAGVQHAAVCSVSQRSSESSTSRSRQYTLVTTLQQQGYNMFYVLMHEFNVE